MSNGPFFSVLTNTGAQIETDAKADNQPVTLAHISVGDGSLPTTVDGLKVRTALLNERHRVSIEKISRNPAYPDELVIEARVPEDVGGWYVREVGIHHQDGSLYGIARWPETYKPASNNVDAEIYLRVVIKTTGDPSITYVGGGVNPEIPEQSVIDLIRNTGTSESLSGSARTATQAEVGSGLLDFLIVSPKKLKIWWDSVRTWGNISNKPDTATRWPNWSEVGNKQNASTSSYGQTKLNNSTTSTSTTEAATPNAVNEVRKLADRSASESQKGQVEIANQTETNAGSDDLKAVSPRKLKAWWDSVRTWGNISNKPDTATRWPNWSEVGNKQNASMTVYGQTKLNNLTTSTSTSEAATPNAVNEVRKLADRSASESQKGQVEIATQAETNAGSDDLRVLSPKKLKAWWDSVRRWGNIQDKPETATRWPSAGEVSGLGTAATKNIGLLTGQLPVIGNPVGDGVNAAVVEEIVENQFGVAIILTNGYKIMSGVVTVGAPYSQHNFPVGFETTDIKLRANTSTNYGDQPAYSTSGVPLVYSGVLSKTKFGGHTVYSHSNATTSHKVHWSAEGY